MSIRMDEEAFKDDIICVVGTHSPFSMEVPFVSLEEIIFGNGMDRLTDLLELYGIYETGRQPERISGTIIHNFVRYLNSEMLSGYVEHVIRGLEQQFSLTLSKPQYVTLTLHLCCLVERELFLKPSYPDETLGISESICLKIRECFQEIQDVYKVEIHSYEIQVIYEILQDFSHVLGTDKLDL